MSGLENLEIILNKSPIINTFNANFFAESPEDVDAYYSEIALSHMSLGDTTNICDRITKCIIENKSTFNGAVVGDYGFGKTSLLIYLWHFCGQNKILAIPPYQWSKFQEHFKVISSWLKYIFRKNLAHQREINDICERYSTPSLKKKAEEMVSMVGTSYADAFDYLEKQFQNGDLILEFSATDLMHFCKEISEYIVEKTDWRGLLIITDELQQTITQLSQKNVYDYLFDITNYLSGNVGNFGFLWGFPTNTFADLGRTRGDILDRLNSNKVFIRLSDLYDNKFPIYLWKKYKTALEIDDSVCPVINENTLISIGQVCDGERRDLGNGPRSVTSTFNVMARRYLDHHQTYEVNDFVTDCLDREIILGETSVYKKSVDEIIEDDIISEDIKFATKILAGFPAGLPHSAIERYKIKEDLEKLIRKTGGFGRVITKNLHNNNYILKNLQRRTATDHDLSELEKEVASFYVNFSDDKDSRKIAMLIFNKILTTQIFSKNSGSSFETWTLIQDWHQTTLGCECSINGSFSQKYPKRNVGLLTKMEKYQEDYFLEAGKQNHLAFSFVLCWSDDIEKNKIHKKGEKEFQLNLDMKYNQDRLGLNKISQIIPEEAHTPYLFLNLIDFLSKANIPSVEYPEREHLTNKLTECIIFNLFNEEFLGEIENIDIELNSQGKDIIVDTFNFYFNYKYPEYITLYTCRDWESKVDRYINVLKQESSQINLLHRRGKEAIILSSDKNENKEVIANFFGQKRTNFEPWLSGLESFFQCKAQDNYFRFLQHPLELDVTDFLENNGKERLINSKPSRYVDINDGLLSVVNSKGYLNEEFDKLLRICAARKLFVYDKEQNCIYRVKEDRESFVGLCEKYFIEVSEGVNKLSIFDDYAVPDGISSVSDMIREIETEEQYDKVIKILKRCEDNNIYYSSRKIDKLKIDAASCKRQLKEVESKIATKASSLKTELGGSASWKMNLFYARLNLENEAESIKKSIVKAIDELNKIEISGYPNDRTIVDILINRVTNFNDLIQNAFKEIENESNYLIKRISNYEKWNSILRSHEILAEQINKFENILENKTYGPSFRGIDEEILSGLQNNQQNTLANHEFYRCKFNDLRSLHSKETDNLKSEWENSVKKYEILIKKLSGVQPQWRLHWTTPGISYNDLYESIKQSLTVEVEKQLSLYRHLQDDVEYTKEVLNHKIAITNKEIDTSIIKRVQSLTEISETDVLNEYRKDKETFEKIIDILILSNEEFGRLNGEHQKIIKPAAIEDTKEKQFFDLLEKNDIKDLKKLIIDYQKLNAESTLTESRDQVLEILKSLFLKKQITIQVKKGKV